MRQLTMKRLPLAVDAVAVTLDTDAIGESNF